MLVAADNPSPNFNVSGVGGGKSLPSAARAVAAILEGVDEAVCDEQPVTVSNVAADAIVTTMVLVLIKFM